DISNRREIVKIDKSLGGGFQFSFWIPEHRRVPGMKRGPIFTDPPGSSFRHFRVCSNRFAIASNCSNAVLAISLRQMLFICAMRHLLSGGLFRRRRLPSLRRYPPA